MNHYKRERITKQESEFKAPVALFSGIDQLLDYFNKLPRRQRDLLDNIFFPANRHKEVFPTQSTLGKKSKLSRSYTNKILLKFEKQGIIARNYRHMTSNLYKVAEIFNELNVREKLRQLFPAFKYLPLVLCLARGYTIKTINDTQTNISLASNIYITNPKGIKDDNRHPLARAVMQHAAENPIPPSIQKLKSLNLTKAGQIRLTCFPDEAIEYAAEKLKYAKNARDPYALFFSVCKDYCQNNQLLPNWERVKSLMQKYTIAEDAPRVRSAAQPPVAQVAAKKQEPKKAEVETKKLGPYQLWESPEPRPVEDPDEAADKVDRSYATPELAGIVALLGLKNPYRKKATP